VTNVTNFGAFVDIGVHQDGLVHISCLADKFVDDPHKVVKAGQIVKVKVLEVDIQRKRVALTMKLQESKQRYEQGQREGGKQGLKRHSTGGGKARYNSQNNRTQENGRQSGKPMANNAMAAKLAAAFKK